MYIYIYNIFTYIYIYINIYIYMKLISLGLCDFYALSFSLLGFFLFLLGFFSLLAHPLCILSLLAPPPGLDFPA